MNTTNNQSFKVKAMSVPDELYWYNNNTNWDALTRKEFRDIMIRMETLTTDFYSDLEDFPRAYSTRSSAAIRKFWADEWGCEYLPESGVWRDLESGTEIKSETQKKAERDAAKVAKKEAKAAKKAAKEAKAAKKAAKAEKKALKQQTQTQTQQQQQQQSDSWFDEEEETYAEAYAQARAQEEARRQEEAQAYLDSFNYTYTSEEEEETQPTSTRVSCQPVLYFEELTDVQGDPDWRAYIYYDERIRCYVFKGTRRSLKATSKKTMYPEVKLCFRSSNDLASYLCSSTDALLNVSLYAISSATVKDATFAELYALPARGYKTELFGYDQTRPRYSTFVNYLRMVRTVDATHSTFAAF